MPTSSQPPSEIFFDTSLWIKGAWYRALQPTIEKVTRITAINELASNSDQASSTAEEFIQELLTRLGVQWNFASQLPEPDGRGRLILANHPTGFVESLVMMKILEQLDPENWRLLGNEFTARKPQFEGHIIALDPFNAAGGTRINRIGLREGSKTLRGGGVLGAFPAGRVAAKKDEHGIVDQPWSMHLTRLAQKTGAQILIARMPWEPGALLRNFPTKLPALRALLLSQETFRHHNDTPRTIQLVPAPDNLSKDPQEATNELQNFCHELSH